jgi:hypothetical protein
VCVTCMRWCSNTKSVPQFVSNIPVIIQVHSRYIPVCTSMYHYTFHVLACTGMYQYVPVRTGTYQIPCSGTSGQDCRCWSIPGRLALSGRICCDSKCMLFKSTCFDIIPVHNIIASACMIIYMILWYGSETLQSQYRMNWTMISYFIS